MSSLPENIHSSLISILEGLLSPDNSIRSNAEHQLESTWFTSDGIEMLLLFLAEQATSGKSDVIRAFSAVIFRRYAVRIPPEHSTSMTATSIGTISEPVRAQIRTILFDGFVAQQTNNVRHKLADAIAEVAAISQKGTWDQLFPTLFEATKSSDVSFRESSFRVFGAKPYLLLEHTDRLLPIFNEGFADSEDSVKLVATTAFVAFFDIVPKKQRGIFTPLLPTLLNALPKYLNEGNEDALTSELESLIELVSLAPKMFREMLPTIIQFCSEITRNTSIDLSARLASLELLTTFCEAAPNMCKLTPEYAECMVSLTLQLMTEICDDDDEAIEWQNNSDREAQDEEQYEAARNSLDRAALSLNGKVLADPLFRYITQMISSSQWRERQAALMALSSAAEGCQDVLISEIPKILDLILPSLNDPHPRVQYACCNALGQCSTDFADVIQITAGNRILPALISKLTNDSVPRVQTHAAAALVNFSENATNQILEPYLDDLLNNLLTMLQGPHRYVQEQVLTTIAIVADAAQSKFIKYYDTLMPLLFNVLESDIGKENRVLKAKSIECSTLIASAVGKEKFSQHSTHLIELFGKIQDGIEDDDDPVIIYLQQGWNTICSIIGTDFLPLLPKVLPPLIEQAKVEQVVKLVDEGDDVNQDEQWEVYPVAGRHVALHTAILDDKVTAMDILRSYCDILQGAFYPYARPIITEILLPAFDFYFHDGVRESAANAIPSFLYACKVASDSNSQEVTTLWDIIATKIIESLNTEPLVEIMIGYYACLYKCLIYLRDDSLSGEHMEKLVTALDSNLQGVYTRVKERDEQNNEEEFDEGLDEENSEASDEELLDEINKTVATVFKFEKAKFIQYFQSLAGTLSTFLQDNNKILKLCGLCMVVDLIDNTGASSAMFQQLFLNEVAESIASPHTAIREVSANIIGAAALRGGEEYSHFVISTIEPLFKLVSVPDARLDDNIIPTEAAVSAIAKVLHVYNSRIPNGDVYISNWILVLPIVSDSQSAAFAYMYLTSLIESQHPSIEKNFPKVIESILQACVHGSISGNALEKTVTACKQLLGNIPQETAMSFFSKYNDDEQAQLQKLFS